MASLYHTNAKLLQTILLVSRPQVRASLNIPVGWQHRCQFSAAKPLCQLESGFSVSFPLEFDDTTKSPKKGSPSKPKAASRTRKPTARAISEGLKTSTPLPVSRTSQGTNGTRKVGDSKRQDYTTTDKFKELVERAEEKTGGIDSLEEKSEDPSSGINDISTGLSLEPDGKPTVEKGSERRSKQETNNTPLPGPSQRKEEWQIQKQALQKKFGETGWNPRKKLSPDTIEGIRALHGQYPDKYTTAVLADEFKVSAEAIRRILKSKWRPDSEKMEERRERWARRHDRIWDQQAELGLRPQRVKEKKIENPDAFEEGRRARQILGNR
jgi:Neugrin